MPDRALQDMDNQDKIKKKQHIPGDKKEPQAPTPIPKSSKNMANKENDMIFKGAGSSSSRQLSDSDDSNDSNDNDTGKRLRTNEQAAGFLIPGVSSSPPKFVSLEEIMQAANGVTNMALAHEIAVDKDFKLEKYKTQENSFEERLRTQMHRAFWDMLDEDLKQKPPSFTKAISLFQEIREGLLGLLLPQHTRLRQNISDTLDVDLVSQQAEKGTLDFQQYAQYIISTMGQLCAPVRDEKIRDLTATKDVIPLFRGILELLELMRIDMANFTIQQIRPHIVAQSVEYEKKKFAEFLKTLGGPEGLVKTREWLKRHRISDDDTNAQGSLNALVTLILNDAYMELIEWNSDEEFPETLMMDQYRYLELKSKIRRIDLVAASILVTITKCPLPLQNATGFKDGLREKFTVLFEEETDDKDLERVLPLVAALAMKEVDIGLSRLNITLMNSEQKKILESEILDIANPKHKVRQLIHQRVLEFLKEVLSSPTAAPQRIPPGLSAMQRELAGAAGQFLRLTAHNRAVFGEHYADLISKYCLPNNDKGLAS